MREFKSGANRNNIEGKLDYEGFYCPLVKKSHAEYMHKNRTTDDGTLRDSDNWQNGFPRDVLMKSMYRHFEHVHLIHRGYEDTKELEEALNGVMFNAQAMLREVLLDRDLGE